MGEERTSEVRAEAVTAGCCCNDPYAALPAELRLKPQPGKAGLRQATCPACGLAYWTNRATDVCIACESG